MDAYFHKTKAQYIDKHTAYQHTLNLVHSKISYPLQMPNPDEKSVRNVKKIAPKQLCQQAPEQNIKVYF